MGGNLPATKPYDGTEGKNFYDFQSSFTAWCGHLRGLPAYTLPPQKIRYSMLKEQWVVRASSFESWLENHDAAIVTASDAEQGDILDVFWRLAQAEYGAASATEIASFPSLAMGKGPGVPGEEDPKAWGVRLSKAYEPLKNQYNPGYVKELYIAGLPDMDGLSLRVRDWYTDQDSSAVSLPQLAQQAALKFKNLSISRAMRNQPSNYDLGQSIGPSAAANSVVASASGFPITFYTGEALDTYVKKHYNSRPFCRHCNVYGHSEPTCYKLNGQQPRAAVPAQQLPPPAARLSASYHAVPPPLSLQPAPFKKVTFVPATASTAELVPTRPTLPTLPTLPFEGYHAHHVDATPAAVQATRYADVLATLALPSDHTAPVWDPLSRSVYSCPERTEPPSCNTVFCH